MQAARFALTFVVLAACEARGATGTSLAARGGSDLPAPSSTGTNGGGAAAPGGSTTGASSSMTRGVSKDGWNTTQIKWQVFATGMRQAKSENKPVCLVFYTQWCPHCRAYSHVFEDERIVARARDFVMIRVDDDASPEISARFMPDGKYIPRTYFLTSDGTLDASLHAPTKEYQFFYHEHDPSSLLAGMQAAARKLAMR
jgi:thiol-disulfide isomerase/thioredoxin